MKQGDLLRVELCGPDSNPKESGMYFTSMGWTYFDFLSNKWFGIPDDEVFPDSWLKPVGKTEEDLQEEAWNASRAREEKPMGMLAKFRWFKFQQWRSEYLKQQDR